MRGSVILAVITAALGAPAGASAANDGFIEHVRVLHEWHGAPDGYFGWAVSELGDVDYDGVGDFITSEPLTGGGITWVYSGAGGDPIYRLEGAPGDFHGTAIADAGDTDGDGVDDILSGASGDGVLMPGRAYLYSGSTRELVHTWEARARTTSSATRSRAQAIRTATRTSSCAGSAEPTPARSTWSQESRRGDVKATAVDFPRGAVTVGT